MNLEADQMFEVQLEWTLADGAPVFSYLQSCDIDVPFDSYVVGSTVYTPQGVIAFLVQQCQLI